MSLIEYHIAISHLLTQRSKLDAAHMYTSDENVLQRQITNVLIATAKYQLACISQRYSIVEIVMIGLSPNCVESRPRKC